MKNNFYARKKRQLKYRIKLLKQVASIQEPTSKVNKLKREIKQLIEELRYVISGAKLRRIIGGAAMLLSLGAAQNLQAQAFAPPVENPFNLKQTTVVSVPTLGDLDGDGDLDMLIGNYDGEIQYYRNQGNPTIPLFVAPVTNPFNIAPPGQIILPTLVDLDTDGDLDIVAYTDYGQISFFENVGNTVVPLYSANVNEAFGMILPYLAIPAFADIDDDGDLDLMLSLENGIQIQLNIGSPTAPEFDTPVINPYGITGASDEAAFPIWVDLDGDGDFDILMSDYGVFGYQENIGTPTAPDYGPNQITPFGLVDLGGTFSNLTAGDLDGDGDIDILSGRYNGPITFHELVSYVDMEEILDEITVSIFPNPTDQILNVQTNLEIQSFEIFDILGRTIQQNMFNQNSIDLSNLVSGSYILKLRTNENELVVKRFEKI